MHIIARAVYVTSFRAYGFHLSPRVLLCLALLVFVGVVISAAIIGLVMIRRR